MADETPEGVEARIAKVAAARDAAKAEAAELRATLARLESEIAPLRIVAGKYETESKAWTAERTFLEVGITDPEARELAVWAHGKLPEEGRPELGVWLAAIKADPTKAPRALAPYLTTAAPPPTPGSPPPPPVPPPVRSVQTTPTAPGVVTAAAIKAATARAQQTGKWDEVNALAAAVNTELAATRGGGR